jgi:diacylglycerol kinase (ATP)
VTREPGAIVSRRSVLDQGRPHIINRVTAKRRSPALRCLIIANPAAGTASPRLTEELSAACAGHGAAVRIVWTTSAGHAACVAADAVRQSGAGEFLIIVSVGGDGTTREVARGMVAGQARPEHHGLLVIPAGTGNSTYRAFWGDQPWAAALDAALSDPAGLVQAVDLARVVECDQLVVLGAGAGLTARVLDGAREVALPGPARLQAGLERALDGFAPYPGRVTVDGLVAYDGPTVFANVGGGRYRAWQYQVLPLSVLDDGLLDVCVVGAAAAAGGFGELQDLLRQGRHLGRAGVVYDRGHRIVLERTDGGALCFEHDGNLVPGAGSLVTLEVLPRLLPALCAPAVIRP